MSILSHNIKKLVKKAECFFSFDTTVDKGFDSSVHIESILCANLKDIIAVSRQNDPNLIPEDQCGHSSHNNEASLGELEAGESFLHIISLFKVLIIFGQMEESDDEL